MDDVMTWTEFMPTPSHCADHADRERTEAALRDLDVLRSCGLIELCNGDCPDECQGRTTGIVYHSAPGVDGMDILDAMDESTREYVFELNVARRLARDTRDALDG